MTRAAFDLADDETLHSGVVGPFGGFHVALEHRKLVAILLELEQPGALRGQRFPQIRLAQAALARRALDSRQDFPHLGVESLAQAPVLGDLTLVLRIVDAVLCRELVQLRLSLLEIRLKLLNERIVENLRQPIQRSLPFEELARLPLPAIPLECLFLRPEHLLRQDPNPAVIDVQALVVRDDSLSPLIIGQLGLSVLQIGPKALQLLVEPHRRLARGLHAQREHRVDIGFGKPIGDPRRLGRVNG